MSTTRDEDIATARQFYSDLLDFSMRLQEAGDKVRNRGHLLEVQSHLRKARESLELFIGDRMTKDIREEHAKAGWQGL